MDGIAPGRVILLNGVGSVGKSSIARALQGMTREPFLHVQMDAFLEMLPEALQDHPNGVFYERLDEDGHPAIAVHSGPVADTLFRGMIDAVAALARQGNNLIIDEVLLGDTGTRYAQALAGLDFSMVGVFAPLEVLEAREKARGDRLIGLARWQYPRVHRDVRYDFDVDAGVDSAEECARLICERFGL